MKRKGYVKKTRKKTNKRACEEEEVCPKKK